MSPASHNPRSQAPEPPLPVDAVPEIFNWPVQKRKLWRGKGTAPSWYEVRRVARGAIDDALGTLPARQLIDAISPLYRDAGLEAYRNKRDKSARLKKEFYSEVMDILGEIARKEAEKRRAGDEAARGPPALETVTCRDAPASTVPEADVKAEAGARKRLTASGASEPASAVIHPVTDQTSKGSRWEVSEGNREDVKKCRGQVDTENQNSRQDEATAKEAFTGIFWPLTLLATRAPDDSAPEGLPNHMDKKDLNGAENLNLAVIDGWVHVRKELGQESVA